MKQATPILNKYHQFIEHGIDGENGLCEHFSHLKNWDLLCPSDDEIEELEDAGFCSTWWASGETAKDIDIYSQGKMTPMRENITLLLACLEGEL
jgi:hypothetical protein